MKIENLKIHLKNKHDCKNMLGANEACWNLLNFFFRNVSNIIGFSFEIFDTQTPPPPPLNTLLLRIQKLKHKQIFICNIYIIVSTNGAQDKSAMIFTFRMLLFSILIVLSSILSIRSSSGMSWYMCVHVLASVVALLRSCMSVARELCILYCICF